MGVDFVLTNQLEEVLEVAESFGTKRIIYEDINSNSLR